MAIEVKVNGRCISGAVSSCHHSGPVIGSSSNSRSDWVEEDFASDNQNSETSTFNQFVFEMKQRSIKRKFDKGQKVDIFC